MEDKLKILGLDRNVTRKDLKSTYRKLSFKYHPDRNNGTRESNVKFQEITDAYNYLNDNFDSLQNTSNYNNFSNDPKLYNMDDILKNVFNRDNLTGLFSSVNGEKPPPIIKKIEITFESAYNGCNIPILIERWLGNPQFNNIEKEKLYVKIPPGIDENEIIIVREKGNYINEYIKGDVKIFIHIKQHDIFSRNGLDLKLKKRVSLKEALCGFNIVIKHLNGKTFNIRNNSILYDNSLKNIKQLGFKRDDAIGNLIIEFTIEFPKALSQEQKKILSEVL